MHHGLNNSATKIGIKHKNNENNYNVCCSAGIWLLKRKSLLFVTVYKTDKENNISFFVANSKFDFTDCLNKKGTVILKMGEM